jgi:hypothetical protein
MKRILLVTLLILGLPVASIAQRGCLVGPPHDDPNARREVYLGRTELKPFIAEYDHTIKTRIAPLEAEGLPKVFGPWLEHRRFMPWYPTNSVAPLFAPYQLSFTGLLMGEDKAHRDLYAAGDTGYVELFYERDGEFKTAVFYAPLDDKFVPLTSTNDFARRLEWDKAKFEAFKKWLDARPLPVVDARLAIRKRAEDLLAVVRSRQWSNCVTFVAVKTDAETLRRMGTQTNATADAVAQAVGAWFKSLYDAVQPGKAVQAVHIRPGGELAILLYMHGDLDGFYMRKVDGEWFYTLDETTEPSGPANRGQPVRSGTNQPPAAAGPGG